MSAGRQLCVTMIDAAERMRRYAAALADFETPETDDLAASLLSRAQSIERVVPTILAFEGETPRLLTVAAEA